MSKLGKQKKENLGTATEPSPISCKIHPGCNYKTFCQKCQDILCEQCFTTDHRGHQVTPFSNCKMSLKKMCMDKMAVLFDATSAVKLDDENAAKLKENRLDNLTKTKRELAGRKRELIKYIESTYSTSLADIDSEIKMLTGQNDRSRKDLCDKAEEVDARLAAVRHSEDVDAIVRALGEFKVTFPEIRDASKMQIPVILNTPSTSSFKVTVEETYPVIRECLSTKKTKQDGTQSGAKSTTKPDAEMKDPWQIERSQIKLDKRLGIGRFADIWKGMWNGTTPVAVKIFKDGTCTPQEFLKEAEIMKSFRHPKLVNLYAVCSKDDPFYIITELMVNGILLEYLRKDEMRPEHEKITFKTMVDYAAQIASGMQYLEENKVIHRDLAARNILVHHNNEVKVSNFEQAVIVADGEYKAELNEPFPIKWSAPEVYIDRTITTKSEVWSFGILLVEIVTYGIEPYPGMKIQEVLHKLESGYRIPQHTLGEKCNDNIYQIMKFCWESKPEKRPTFEYLFRYFDDYRDTE